MDKQRTEVTVKDNVVVILPLATRLPRSAFLPLAQMYAPEGKKAVMAEGGTGFVSHTDGTERLAHEFWLEDA